MPQYLCFYCSASAEPVEVKRGGEFIIKKIIGIVSNGE